MVESLPCTCWANTRTQDSQALEMFGEQAAQNIEVFRDYGPTSHSGILRHFLLFPYPEYSLRIEKNGRYRVNRPFVGTEISITHRFQVAV